MGLFDFFKTAKPQPVEEFNLSGERFRELLIKENVDPSAAENVVNAIQRDINTTVQEKREYSYDDFITSVTERIETIYTKPTDRLRRCQLIEEFVSDNPEAFNSIRLYTSYISYGSVEMKMDEYRTILNGEDPEKVKRAEAIIKNFERTSKIKRFIYMISGDMIKYGDAFLEILRDDNNKIKGLAYLPSKDIMILLNDQGFVKNLYQIIDKQFDYTDFNILQKFSKLAEKKVIEFAPNEVVHFNDGTLPGLADSPLSSLAIVWKSLKLIEESLIIHRITRARRLIMFFLDVTGKTSQDAKRAMTRFADKLNSVFRINVDKGRSERNKSIIKQGSDIIIPVTKGTETKVQAIPSDVTSTKVDDLKFYHNRIMTNLMTSHIFGEGKTGKEEIMEKALIRLVRTYQRQASFALEDLYNAILLENNLGDVICCVNFPSPDLNEEIKLVDTIIRRMMVVNQLIATLGVVPPNEWIITYVFKDLTQPELTELISLIQAEKKKAEGAQGGSEFLNVIDEGDSAAQETGTSPNSGFTPASDIQRDETANPLQPTVPNPSSHLLMNMFSDGSEGTDSLFSEGIPRNLYESRSRTRQQNALNIDREKEVILKRMSAVMDLGIRYLETKKSKD